MNPATTLSHAARLGVLSAAFAGLVFAGVQLGLMPLASISISKSLLGPAFTDNAAKHWFANYTAALMLGAAFGGMTLGGLGDRIGRTRAMGVSILCYALAGGGGAFVTSQEQLLVLRFLAGFGVGGMWPNGVALVSECWTNASRPLVAGVVGTGLNIGILCVSQLGRWRDVTAESWRWLMEISAVPAVLGLLALWLVPESPRWLAARGQPDASTQVGSGAERQRNSSPFLELFSPTLWRVTLIGIALGAIPLIGAWGASKWMIPWADKIAGTAQPGYKAATQGYWAVGAIFGSFFGGHLANVLGRRITYFLISLGSVVLTCGIFLLLKPLEPAFLPTVFVQGFVSTLFFGWLPLYLPELFPTRVRATGSGVAYNFGRFVSAAGVLASGSVSGSDYARVGLVTGMVYALGMVVIWWAPDTSKKSMDD